MKRIITALTAAALGLCAVAWAQGQFSDVPADHRHLTDIETVADWGGYSGYSDGTFRPDQKIRADQMATVLGRVFPEGMTRAEFASFLVGGKWKKDNPTPNPVAATTTTVASTAVNYPEVCEAVYLEMVASAYNEYGYYEDYDFRPDAYKERIGYSDVLKVYEWYGRIHTPTGTFLLCQGRAKLDNGKSVPIVAYTTMDVDGDSFWGYAFPVAGPTCGEAKRQELTVDDYNVRYLYGSARDSDGDRIMCESLKEGSVKVGSDNRIPR